MTPAPTLPSPTASPLTAYTTRLALHRAAAARCARNNRRITQGRRLVLIAVIGYVVFDPTEIHALVPLGIALIPFVFVQNYVQRLWRRASRTAAYYRRGLERLENRWIGHGPDGRRYQDADHLYADDLDIFGRGSLYQLLCTARTRMGQDTLAAWLKTPGSLAEIRSRQQAVESSRGDLDLRESLATVDALVGGLDPAGAVAWAEADPIFPSRAVALTGTVIAWVLVACGIGALAIGHAWVRALLFMILVQAAFYLWRRRRAWAVGQHVAAAGQALDVLLRLRAVAPRGATLGTRVTELNADVGFSAPWSAALYGLLLQNSFLNLFAAQLIPYLEPWRRRAQQGLPAALAAAGELEALAALSAYAYEHPDDPFAELVETGPLFSAVALAHPLMPPGVCVPNDVRLDSAQRLILISGSNMSGKSTLLRSLGTNTVLALAGAPVRAQRLGISPLTVGTAMRFRDSVHEGASYFYAVLKRLRGVLEVAGGEPPLLFLFDEILQGTNSQDRLVGAEAVMRRLLASGAIGLLTTHDLALTKIVDDLGSRATNMHCQDQVADGQMTFDYKLRPGVVTKSNALALMRSMGLDV